jgi:VanZ family protein
MTLKKYLITAAFLILLAVLDELHQKLIPGRSFNVEDILSNITGILAGLIFCVLIFRKIARRLKDQS